MAIPLKAGTRSLENATVRLLKRRPFYGHLLLGLRRQLVEKTYPVGVTIISGTPTLYCNPTLFAVCTAYQQQALLEHCLNHLLHLHPLRRQNLHSMTWGLACDLSINPGIDGMPDGSLMPDQFQFEAGLAAEEYARLLATQFDIGSLKGEGIGRAEREQGGGSGCGEGLEARESVVQRIRDDHQAWYEADSTPEKLAEQAVRDLVREAHRKAGGELPDDVRALVAGWLVPPMIPWRQVLRQFIGTAGRIGRKNTWQREHRRFQHTAPGSRKRRLLNLLVAIDVSESTDRQPLREQFAGELLQIARGRASQLTVLYAHSRIRRIETFRSSRLAVEVFHGGGFTDLRPVFDYAKQMLPRPAAVIYLTDGYGPAPESMEFPTLWVLTADGRKPVEWGVELRMARQG